MDIIFYFGSILFSLAVVAMIISVHEAAHAFTANSLGDPTAKMAGRQSLNPLAHIDLFGTVLLPLMLIILHLPLFGWAKPTPFNPLNLQNPKRDSALIALAGPVSNLLLAALLALIARLLFPGDPMAILQSLLYPLVTINVSLAVFNLLPIEPLDGFKVVGGILPDGLAAFWYSLAPYGPLLLLFLLFTPGTSLLDRIFLPLTKTILSLLFGFPVALY